MSDLGGMVPMLSTTPLAAPPTFLAPPPMAGSAWSQLTPPPQSRWGHLPPPPAYGGGRPARKGSAGLIVLLTLGAGALGALAVTAGAVLLMLFSFGCGCA